MKKEFPNPTVFPMMPSVQGTSIPQQMCLNDLQQWMMECIASNKTASEKLTCVDDYVNYVDGTCDNYRNHPDYHASETAILECFRHLYYIAAQVYVLLVDPNTQDEEARQKITNKSNDCFRKAGV